MLSGHKITTDVHAVSRLCQLAAICPKVALPNTLVLILPLQHGTPRLGALLTS